MERLNLDVEKNIREYKSRERKGISREGTWTEQDMATKAGMPLVDSATGKKVIIRTFDYNWDKKMKPEEIEMIKLDKQGFFNSHARYIKDFLWKDGLSVLENQDPRLIFNKKGYRIAVACEAKFGASIFEKGMTLQDIMKPITKLAKKK